MVLPHPKRPYQTSGTVWCALAGRPIRTDSCGPTHPCTKFRPSLHQADSERVLPWPPTSDKYGTPKPLPTPNPCTHLHCHTGSITVCGPGHRSCRHILLASSHIPVSPSSTTATGMNDITGCFLCRPSSNVSPQPNI
jgi:hypothetical protein